MIVKQLLPLPYSIHAACRPTIATGPRDASDMAQVYNKVTTFEGFIKFMVKTMDYLTAGDYSEQATELRADIKTDSAFLTLPLTGMMEEYAEAGRTKDALVVFKKCAVKKRNAYVYSVIIKALFCLCFLGAAKECVMEMMGRGMELNADAYAVVFEGFVEKGKAEEGRKLVEEMKGKGFVAEKKAVREILQGRRKNVVDKVIKMVFGNNSS